MGGPNFWNSGLPPKQFEDSAASNPPPADRDDTSHAAAAQPIDEHAPDSEMPMEQRLGAPAVNNAAAAKPDPAKDFNITLKLRPEFLIGTITGGKGEGGWGEAQRVSAMVGFNNLGPGALTVKALVGPMANFNVYKAANGFLDTPGAARNADSGSIYRGLLSARYDAKFLDGALALGLEGEAMGDLTFRPGKPGKAKFGANESETYLTIRSDANIFGALGKGDAPPKLHLNIVGEYLQHKDIGSSNDKMRGDFQVATVTTKRPTAYLMMGVQKSINDWKFEAGVYGGVAARQYVSGKGAAPRKNAQGQPLNSQNQPIVDGKAIGADGKPVMDGDTKPATDNLDGEWFALRGFAGGYLNIDYKNIKLELSYAHAFGPADQSVGTVSAFGGFTAAIPTGDTLWAKLRADVDMGQWF